MIRHGATAPSSAGLYVGRTDPPLNESGCEQARAWRPFGRHHAGAHVYHSPLIRAEQTAVLGGFLSPAPSELLVEWDLGELEGSVAEVYRAQHPDWSLFLDGPPGGSGERPEAVAARARAAVSALYEPLADDEIGVFVAHGQFLKALATIMLGLPLREASAFALGPARAGVFTRRTTGRIALTGWNLPAPVHPAEFFRGLT
ncbi:histidine phosphatase family protein [Catellatospora citrea]|uniref:histidine phosphatase family protein n=1 Tax=Catellatospora citrea TaxID=53366 RepID=UPI0014769541|nr:histidine phosphatase family protein [Catellatospora citrea]